MVKILLNLAFYKDIDSFCIDGASGDTDSEMDEDADIMNLEDVPEEGPDDVDAPPSTSLN